MLHISFSIKKNGGDGLLRNNFSQKSKFNNAFGRENRSGRRWPPACLRRGFQKEHVKQMNIRQWWHSKTLTLIYFFKFCFGILMFRVKWHWWKYITFNIPRLNCYDKFIYWEYIDRECTPNFTRCIWCLSWFQGLSSINQMTLHICKCDMVFYVCIKISFLFLFGKIVEF